MRRLCFILIFLLSALPASAETVEIVPGRYLEFSLPGEQWLFASVPPDFLIAKTAAHMEPGMLKMVSKGKPMTTRDAARKILSANELFVYNPSSEATLVVDFSPLREGEKLPLAKTIQASARYAGESLETEDGLSNVSQKTARTSIEGASIAHRLDASYDKHGQDVRFIGIIGFAEPYWFFLYYTDFQKNPVDLKEMEALLKTVRIVQ